MNAIDFEPAWQLDLLDAPLPFDWRHHGESFVSLVMDRLREISGVHGHGGTYSTGFPSTRYSWVLLRPNTTTPFATRLLLVRLEDGIHASLIGEDPRREREVAQFSDAVRHVVALLEQDEPTHRWHALVGEDPAGRHNSPHETLMGELGAITITASSSFVEFAPLNASSPHGGQVLTTQISQVSGSTAAHSIEAASNRATAELHRLCLLLTVMLERAWIVRREATIGEDPEEKVPSHPRTQPQLAEFARATTSSRVAKPPPRWADDAWQRLTSEPVVRDAASAHLEGCQLAGRHPSLALIAFVAAIERLGQLEFEVEQCTCCENCDLKRGYGRRFRHAVQSVLPQLPKKLIDTAYSHRSSTAHDGRLHGFEIGFGAFDFPALIDADDPRNFRSQLVEPFRRASHLLLERVVSTGSIQA